jgi:hypothetical protein
MLRSRQRVDVFVGDIWWHGKGTFHSVSIITSATLCTPCDESIPRQMQSPQHNDAQICTGKTRFSPETRTSIIHMVVGKAPLELKETQRGSYYSCRCVGESRCCSSTSNSGSSNKESIQGGHCESAQSRSRSSRSGAWPWPGLQPRAQFPWR